MYEVSVETHFSAAHRLAGYPGDCARRHGHNWQVAVSIQAEELNALGMAVDFRRIKDTLGDLLETLDHTDLNEVPELAGSNPTCEVVARYLYEELTRRLNDANTRVVRVRVSETPNTGACYFERHLQ